MFKSKNLNVNGCLWLYNNISRESITQKCYISTSSDRSKDDWSTARDAHTGSEMHTQMRRARKSGDPKGAQSWGFTADPATYPE